MSTRLSWGNASSARAWIAAFVSVLNGCAITTGVNVGVPSATRCLQTSSKNASVTMTAVGHPFRSSATASCTLHDVQDPQSPIAVITASF